MRIAFFCKRRYMGKDVILDRYARLYEIPYQLARRGHDVLGLCLSYTPSAPGQWEHEAGAGRLRWLSRSIGRFRAPGLARYPARALAALRAFDPDLVIGASDVLQVSLASRIARQLKRPFVADLYDDFESFGLARIPGLKPAYRRAVRQAEAVSCTSQALADHVRDCYRARGEIIALPSTVDLSVFRPMDRAACRAELGLPPDAVLVGTAGGLYADKGIGTLYEAFDRLQALRSDVHLVLAGPTDDRRPVPQGPRVHYLGQLPHARAATLFGALDVGVIYLRDTPFGRFCFPQKAYEMLACGLPLVSARIGAMTSLLGSMPESMHPAEDAAALAQCIEIQIDRQWLPQVDIEDWERLVARLDDMLSGVNGR